MCLRHKEDTGCEYLEIMFVLPRKCDRSSKTVIKQQSLLCYLESVEDCVNSNIGSMGDMSWCLENYDKYL